MDFKIATINIKHPLRNTKEVSNSTKPIAKSLHVGMLSRKFRDAASGVFSKRLSWHPPRLQHFKTLFSICGNKRIVCDLKRTKSSFVMDHFFFLSYIKANGKCNVCITAEVLSLEVPGVPWHTQILADQLTLFQPKLFCQ